MPATIVSTLEPAVCIYRNLSLRYIVLLFCAMRFCVVFADNLVGTSLCSHFDL